eukprot:TRINITY_DN11381_c1_g1_i1.p1 TRINITY_DN11381_c1_g1~~TRINITY_DN11381_c1_g1_i1.p1  ORF type:complete len:187 (-),score=33.46 TRINITY_DN11381_c1_g1_i1:6-506(-)
MTASKMLISSVVIGRMVVVAIRVSSQLQQKKVVERCWSTSSHCHKLRQSFASDTDSAVLEAIYEFDELVKKRDFLNLLSSLKMRKITARRIFTLIDDGEGVNINLYLLTLLRISGSGPEHLNMTSILYENKRNAHRLELMMEFLVQEFKKPEAVKKLPHEVVDHEI